MNMFSIGQDLTSLALYGNVPGPPHVCILVVKSVGISLSCLVGQHVQC